MEKYAREFNRRVMVFQLYEQHVPQQQDNENIICGELQAETQCSAAIQSSPSVSPSVFLLHSVDGGSIAFTSRFKYLGSIVTADLRDATDVDNRIASATSAFGALHRCVFSTKDISLVVKKAVYIAIVLSILLYGSESWCLTEVLASRLRRFHNKCVRIMCRVTRHLILPSTNTLVESTQTRG